jgi:hypothetical protein
VSENGFVKSISRPTIFCKSCKGTGKVPIGEEQWETLVALQSLKKATSGELFNELKRVNNGNSSLEQTAINMRLERMRAQKIVARRKRGKSWEYSVT